MNVDVRKVQYQAYRRDHTMAGNQQVILHHVSGARGPPPAPSQPASFTRWNRYSSSRFPWDDMERSLYRPTPTAAVEELSDDDEDDDDDDADSTASQDEEDEEEDEE